jgi:YVTN family beta-propeller protein
MRRLALALVLVSCGDSIVFNEPEHWTEPSLLPPATGARLAFTNSGDDTISFIDADTFAPIAQVPIGSLPVEPEGPHHLQATADGRHLFVGISNYVERIDAATGPHGTHGTGTADGYLLKVDTTTGREIGRVRVSKSPGDVRLSPDGKFVFQSHFDLASVVKAVQDMKPSTDSAFDSFLVGTDASTMEKKLNIRICSAGHGLGFSPDGAKVYVVCWYSDQLAIVDVASQTVQEIILGDDAGAPPAPRYRPYALAVAPDGRVFVSATGPGKKSVMVYEPGATEFDPMKTIATDAGAPQFGDFTEDGSRYYVVTQQADHLLVIDPVALSIVENKPLNELGCFNAHAAKLSPDETKIYLVCEGARTKTPGTFHALDRATLEEVAQVTLGIFPDDVAYLPPPGVAQ